jgi:hypothetical protein
MPWSEPDGPTAEQEAAWDYNTLRDEADRLREALEMAANEFGLIATIEGVPSGAKYFAEVAKKFCDDVLAYAGSRP